MEFGIGALPASELLPITRLSKMDDAELGRWVEAQIEQRGAQAICVVCRRGNDSQRAVLRLRELQNRGMLAPSINIRDLIGGLQAWAQYGDPTFPLY